MRHQPEESVADRLRVAQNKTALAEIIQQQCRQRQAIPGEQDRFAPKMTDIGEERLGSRDRQNHGAQHVIAGDAVAEQEADGIERVERDQNGRAMHQPDQTQHADGDEPQAHDRAEHLPHPIGATRLEEKQSNQDAGGERHDERLKNARRDIEPLDRREHRDRRRDHAIAIQHRRAEQHDKHQHIGPARPAVDVAPGLRIALVFLQQPEYRERAPLAVMIGAEDEREIFDAYHQNHRPEDQRDDADHRYMILRELGRFLKTRRHHIQPVGADIAEHHADGAEREPGQRRLGSRFRLAHAAGPFRWGRQTGSGGIA